MEWETASSLVWASDLKVRQPFGAEMVSTGWWKGIWRCRRGPGLQTGRRVNCQQQHALRSRGPGRVIEVRGLREPRRQVVRLILSLSGVCDGFCTGRGRFF